MRKPHGYAQIVGPPGAQPVGAGNEGVRSLEQHGEADTFTCGHCRAIVHVPVRCDPADMGGLCKTCLRLICPRCHAKNCCTPWEEAFARREARADALRSYGF